MDLTLDDDGVVMVDAAAFFGWLDTDAEAIGLYTFLTVEAGYVQNVRGRCVFSPAVALSITRRLAQAGRVAASKDAQLIGVLQRSGVMFTPDVSGDRLETSTLN